MWNRPLKTYWAVQNTRRTHLLGVVLCIKCFKINFFPKISKIRFLNWKIIFLKMQLFYSQFQKNSNSALFTLFGLLFKKMFVKQSSTTYLTVSKFTIWRLKDPFMVTSTYRPPWLTWQRRISWCLYVKHCYECRKEYM